MPDFARYDAVADRRSWAEMLVFFDEIFGKRPADVTDRPEGSAARLRREAAKTRLSALDAEDAEERQSLTEMAAMFEREAAAIDAALDSL